MCISYPLLESAVYRMFVVTVKLGLSITDLFARFASVLPSARPREEESVLVLSTPTASTTTGLSVVSSTCVI